MDEAIFVVFDGYSGDTHFLNELPFLVLKSIDRRPRTVDEIAERLSDGAALDPDAITQIEKAIVSLESSHLVESLDL